MDDDATWALILTDEWGELTLDAVVRRIEDAMRGDRARLVQTVLDPDHAPPMWVEEVHDLVLSAIHVETGADLDTLGSQAAWGVYEQTWNALRDRWSDGGRLVPIAPADEHSATDLLRALPAAVAQRAGADTSTIPATPLRLQGLLLLDAEGLFAWIAGGGDADFPSTVRRDVDLLLDLARRAVWPADQPGTTNAPNGSRQGNDRERGRRG